MLKESGKNPNTVEYFYYKACCGGVNPPFCINSIVFTPQLQCIELSQLIVNHCLHGMPSKVLGVLALKSIVQSVDSSGRFLFLAQSIALNR